MNIKLTVLLVFMAIGASSQTILIRDQSTREGIPKAIIADKDNNYVETDQKGKADIGTLNKLDSLSIRHIGYFSKKILASGETEISIDLISKIIELNEVVFTPNKSAENLIDVPYKMEIIKAKNIEFGNQPTSAEVLQNTGSVFVQKSQMGGGSPVMRGFEANKTLIVVDGIRMNNAIYRGGHLQDVITLDANMLDRIELQFGPSSTIYGSDALGGVMHFYSKNASFSDNDKLLVKTNAMTRYASTNNETTGHLDFNLGWKNIAFLTNVTYSNFDDLRSGNTKLTGYTNKWDRDYYVATTNGVDSMIANPDPNVQKGSGYKQLDLMQRVAIKTGKYLSHNLNFQSSQSSDIPRYDRLTEYASGKLRFAEWNYGPQKRLLGAYTLNYDQKNLFTDNIKVILAYQKINQDRISRRFKNPVRTSQNEEVTVLSANVDAFKKIKPAHELHYGIEITDNNVNSTAFSTNISTGAETPAATRYADGKNQMSTIAAYASHAWEANKNFVVSSGVRYTYNNLKSEFKDKTFFNFPFNTIEQKSQAVTGSLGLTWKEDNDYKVYLTANTGFRTPNIDDMSKVFESSNNILIVPNPDIKPEYLYNFEMGLVKVVQKKFKFEMVGFYSILENAL
ncbi:MAG TPA: TonB-dependent receptor, partial [Bacteroidia bacterium]